MTVCFNILWYKRHQTTLENLKRCKTAKVRVSPFPPAVNEHNQWINKFRKSRSTRTDFSKGSFPSVMNSQRQIKFAVNMFIFYITVSNLTDCEMLTNTYESCCDLVNTITEVNLQQSSKSFSLLLLLYKKYSESRLRLSDC